MRPDIALIRRSFRCRCPRCGQGALYEDGFWTARVRETCPSCGLRLGENDSGDGPAVFLIFLLGFSLVPLALVLEYWLFPPLWVHAVLWGGAAVGLALGMLRPLKSYIIALQFKHRPGDWTDR